MPEISWSEAVKAIYDISWMAGISHLQAALPAPFKIEVKKETYYHSIETDIKIYVAHDGEKFGVFYGKYCNPSDYYGSFASGFGWAKDALSGFFADLPALLASAEKILENRRKMDDEIFDREINEKSERAKQIYLAAIARKEDAP